MTPDERQLLTRFLQDLSQASAGQKDPEAAGLIAQAVNTNPDAPYLLVQHTVMSDQALHAAQARIAELEAQQRNAGQGQSFFGGATAVPQSAPPQQSYAPPPQQPYPTQPGYAPPPYDARPGPFASGGGLGSFLRSAATTAAGVAGGEALFQGLSGLFGGPRGGGLFGGGGYGMGGPMMGGAPEETIVNNYYDDGSRDDGGGGFGDDDGGFGGDGFDGGADDV
jgi:hypothetical protein